MEGLSSGRADINGNKEITVNEFLEYVKRKVASLEQGNQTPTSRKIIRIIK